MTLENIFSILDAISGFTGKVAYRAFPAEITPELPIITFYEAYSHNFAASNKVYVPIKHIDVELVTSEKSPATEALVEAALDDAELVWEKTETYLDTEKCYQIIYEFEV